MRYDLVESTEFDDVLVAVDVEDEVDTELDAVVKEMEDPHMSYATPIDTQLEFGNVYHRFLDYFSTKD